MPDTHPNGTVVYVRAVISNPAPGDEPWIPSDVTVKLRDGEGGTYRCEIHPEDVRYTVDPDDDDGDCCPCGMCIETIGYDPDIPCPHCKAHGGSDG